jgi:hypothetical protein
MAQSDEPVLWIVRYRRRYYPQHSRYGGHDRGYEFARAHIEAGRQLSAELGGTDEDVKKYFFDLHPTDLAIILDLYEHHYGSQARAYAKNTIEKWRVGRVQMGGQTASRLFRLLPPLMPLQKKYELIGNLWSHFGPSSKKILRVGLDATMDDIISQIRQHIEGVVVQYRIPENLERRFEWLAAGDSHVKQDLLGYLKQREKSLVVEGARVQLPMMIEHLRSSQGNNTHRLAQVLQIGKHELEVSLERGFSGVALIDPPTRSYSAATIITDGNYRWLWWVVGIGVLLFLMLRK